MENYGKNCTRSHAAKFSVKRAQRISIVHTPNEFQEETEDWRDDVVNIFWKEFKPLVSRNFEFDDRRRMKIKWIFPRFLPIKNPT